MKKSKNLPLSHNVCYDETNELYPVYYTFINGYVKKTFSPYKSVPHFFLSFSQRRLVDKYVIRTDTSKYDVMIYQVDDLYFYRLIDSSFASNSIGFTSLDDCLLALRIFADEVNGKLRLFI